MNELWFVGKCVLLEIQTTKQYKHYKNLTRNNELFTIRKSRDD